MSGPYQGYGQQGQGYPQQQPTYGNTYNDPNAYPQQQYQSQGYGAQEFAPIQRQDSYGPPQTGGFQHGQQGQVYGQYNASNPQGHAGYYGGYNHQAQGYPQQQPSYGQPQAPQHNDSFAANQAYQQQMASGQSQPTGAQPDLSNHQFAKQSSDPQAPNYDPNAPPMTEQDRGLLGALGGGFAGHHFGGKQGHGFLGSVGGAILGSFAEDFMKKKKHGGSSHGGSQWGGGSKW